MGRMLKYHVIMDEYTIFPNRTILSSGEVKISPIKMISQNWTDQDSFLCEAAVEDECMKILQNEETDYVISKIEVNTNGVRLICNHSITDEHCWMSIEAEYDVVLEIEIEEHGYGVPGRYRIEGNEEGHLRIVEYLGSFVCKTITFNQSGWTDPDTGGRGDWVMIEEYTDIQNTDSRI